MAKQSAKKQPAKKGAAMAVAPEGLGVHVRGMAKSDATLMEVPLKKVKVVAGFNPRVNTTNIADLQNSIKAVGLLHPLIVAPGTAGTYELVDGERRYNALKALGRETVPVEVRLDLPKVADRLAISGAANSEDGRIALNPIELGRMFQRLSKAGLSVDQIAKKLGHNSRRVRRCLNLMKAPDAVQTAVGKGDLGMMAGLELAKADPALRKAVVNKLNEGHEGDEDFRPSAAEVRKAVKTVSKAAGGTATPGKSAKKKTGADRGASLVTRRSNKDKTAALAEVANMLVTATKDEIETDVWWLLRGMAFFALWERGDLKELPFLTDPESEATPAEVKVAKAILAKIIAILKAEAKNYEPPEEPAEDAAE